MAVEAYQYKDGKGNIFYELDLIIAMAELSFYFPGNRDYIKEVNEWAAKVTGACLHEFSTSRRVDVSYVGRRIGEFHQDLSIAMEMQDRAAVERLKDTKNDLELLAAQPIKNDRRNQMLQ
jgi:hypothetical protein